MIDLTGFCGLDALAAAFDRDGLKLLM